MANTETLAPPTADEAPIEFVEELPKSLRPPTSGGPGRTPHPRYEQWRTALRSRPGEWARLEAHDSQGKAGGRAETAKADGFQFVTRKIAENTWGVFGRFVADDYRQPKRTRGNGESEEG